MCRGSKKLENLHTKREKSKTESKGGKKDSQPRIYRATKYIKKNISLYVYVRRVRHFCRCLSQKIYDFNFKSLFFVLLAFIPYRYNICVCCSQYECDFCILFHSRFSDQYILCTVLECGGFLFLFSLFSKRLRFGFDFLIRRMFLFSPSPVLLLMMLAAMPPQHMTYVKTVSQNQPQMVYS